MLNLPFEVLVSILSFLEVEWIVAVGATCHKVREACSGAHQGLWFSILERLTLGFLSAKNCRCSEDALRCLRAYEAQSRPEVGGVEQSHSHATLHQPKWAVDHLGNDCLATFQRHLLHTVTTLPPHISSVLNLEDKSGNWVKYICCRLFAYGFERFAAHVRLLGRLPTHLLQLHRDALVRLLVASMEAQRVFLTTQLSDVAEVHDSCRSFASADAVVVGLERLRLLVRATAANRLLHRHVKMMLEDYRALLEAVACCVLLSDVSDHPAAQSKYESLWAVHRGTIWNERHAGRHSVRRPENMRSLGPAAAEKEDDDGEQRENIPLASLHTDGSLLSAAQASRIQQIESVFVGDIIQYLNRLSKRDRRSFLANVHSLFNVVLAETAT